MTPRRFFAFAYVALFSAALTAQTPAQQKTQEDEEFLKGVILSTAKGVTAPTLLKSVYPKYTSEAMRAKIQGTVIVQVIVGVDGKVDRARVTTSLDKLYGLDAEALAAAKQYLFTPGKQDGKIVPVASELKLDFRLH